MRWRWPSKPKSDCFTTGERALASQEGTLSHAFILTLELGSVPAFGQLPAVPRGDRDQYPGGG